MCCAFWPLISALLTGNWHAFEHLGILSLAATVIASCTCRQLLAKLGFSEAMLMGTTSNAADAAATVAAAGRKSSVGLAEQHLHSAMEQLNMTDGELWGSAVAVNI